MYDENKAKPAYQPVSDAVDEREMKGAELLAGLAHTVQTPLQSIILNTEMLLELLRQVENPRVRDKGVRILSRIHRETSSLKTLLTDFLALARMTAGKKLPTDINLLIREVVEFIRNECMQRNVEIFLNLDKSVYPVLIDRQLMSHALLNLIKNAAEAIVSNGVIEISTCEVGNMLEISISDDGQGISPADLEHVFEPFYSTKPGGTGLGLSIVKRIINVHGGIVFVQPGKETGTTFVIRIPKGKFIGDPPDLARSDFDIRVEDILQSGFAHDEETR